MKIGIIIALAMTAVLGIVLVLSLYGVPQGRSGATRQTALVQQALPRTLKPMYQVQDKGASVNGAYAELVLFYQDYRHPLSGSNPPADLVTQLEERLLAGMRAGKVTTPFFDDKMALQPMVPLDWRDDALAAVDLVSASARQLNERGDNARALKLAHAVGALGQRLFEESVRLELRLAGMSMLTTAIIDIVQMRTAAPPDPDPIRQWEDALTAIDSAWMQKRQTVFALEPNVADLIAVAQNDRDLTFRIEAMLMLGAVKHRSGSRGNLRIIQSAIDQGLQDPEPMIAAAAQSAQAFTVEQLREMR
jgi:hypothetical protein